LSNASVTEVATGSTPWRQPGIVYKKNECWIDIFEKINLIVSHQGIHFFQFNARYCVVEFNDALFTSSGTVLRSDVEGSIQVTCQLSGMPQLTLGLNDKLQIDKEIASGKR
jgi:hypothetical protein